MRESRTSGSARGARSDKVRRAESKGRPELKRTRYLWLRNEPSLPAEGRSSLQALTRVHLKTVNWPAPDGCIGAEK